MLDDKTYCANCQSETFGEYCSRCGEQRVSAELRSMKYIVSNIIADLTTLDGKVWKTARTVLMRPGKLEHDFAHGRRVDYMKPITLFFLFNVLFVMFSTTNDFYVSFYEQLTLQPYSPLIKPYVVNYVGNQNIDIAKFTEYYDQLVKALARSMIILQVPFFTVFVSILFYNKHCYAGDYFTYSLNAHGWLLIWSLFLQIPFMVIKPLILVYFSDFAMGKIILPAISLGFFTYLFLASRRMFDLSWLQCLWRLPLLFIAYGISHQLFRLVQLFITTALVNVS